MDKKYLNRYESSNTAEKNDFIGKKRYESSSDHYSKDRNSSHLRGDYDSIYLFLVIFVFKIKKAKAIRRMRKTMVFKDLHITRKRKISIIMVK